MQFYDGLYEFAKRWELETRQTNHKKYVDFVIYDIVHKLKLKNCRSFCICDKNQQKFNGVLSLK